MRLEAMLSARDATGHGSVGVDDHHGQAWIRCRRLGAYDMRQDNAMPGHGAVSRFVVRTPGGPRGCLHRLKVSMMIMRPPQQGHGGRRSSGSSVVSSSDGAATFRRSRASARLALRAEPASRP